MQRESTSTAEALTDPADQGMAPYLAAARMRPRRTIPLPGPAPRLAWPPSEITAEACEEAALLFEAGRRHVTQNDATTARLRIEQGMLTLARLKRASRQEGTAGRHLYHVYDFLLRRLRDPEGRLCLEGLLLARDLMASIAAGLRADGDQSQLS